MPKGTLSQPRHDAAVELRRARVECDGVETLGVPHGTCTAVQKLAQHAALVVGRAADDEVLRRLAPVLLEPRDVGFEAAGGADEGLGRHLPRLAVAVHDGGAEHAVVDVQVPHLGFVLHPDAHLLGGLVVGVDQGFAAAQEEGVGAR